MSYFTKADCKIEDFAHLCEQGTDAGKLAFADHVALNVPIYDAAALGAALGDPIRRRALMAEWTWVLGESAGVLVVKGAVDPDAVDAATAVFDRIIADQGTGGGDHFAKAGANARIWNSLQKLCLADPDAFARYHAAPALHAVAEAWLGPAYQMTAQVNLVRPGGAAQEGHRDYHLGFMSDDQVSAYPVHAHHLSPVLTLQGAVAHCDMPVESGPTKLLPFSQSYGPGYLAYRLPAFRDHFEENYIQLPLEKGDALFFSPALFHAGGDNRTGDVQRLANLLQVSSPMGRAIEGVDRAAMVRALYPVLAAAGLTPGARAAVIAAAAEGYAFPTNLDTDPPMAGLAPESMAAMMARMLDAGDTQANFAAALDAWSARRAP
ncbi:MAG TPA: phytanoyl-CoA dioxygenase [Rhodobacteraceae bacterium]|nr:phytanoyl-CoA dioxygenase [Paracoccaceae bacterium]